jgi:hypothetical protein
MGNLTTKEDNAQDVSIITLPAGDLPVSDAQPTGSSSLSNLTTKEDTAMAVSNSTLPNHDLVVSDVRPPGSSSTSNLTIKVETTPVASNSTVLKEEENAWTSRSDVQPIDNSSKIHITINTTQDEDSAMNTSNRTWSEEKGNALTVLDDVQPTNGSSNVSNLTTNTTWDVLPNEFLTPPNRDSSGSNTKITRMCSMFRNLRGCG